MKLLTLRVPLDRDGSLSLSHPSTQLSHLSSYPLSECDFFEFFLRRRVRDGARG
jgi:hypothetical protein